MRGTIDMRRLAAWIAAAATAALLAAAPAGAQVVQDHWSGKWRFTADGGQNYGILRLNLDEADDKTLQGRYTGDTNGTLTATLNRRFGADACGTFKDTSGRNRNAGKFCMFLDTTGVDTFSGWYKPCRVLCSRQQWSGTKL
ncbi:hypothetical protein Cwoe_4557 [Conexibacter woesei DSM 14684]|uniref:DUF2147 domain-containing protein n=2 Tax=Conexibacter TaxID=191494 RepID=D3F8X5_CONWI|nr:hypothetical protein Cwoe_4557 [Conexibacter woesei DSM 14684]